MHTVWKLFFILISAFLAGCIVGSDYKTPETSLPQNWDSAELKKTAVNYQKNIDQLWWENFNDPILNQFIQKAANDNYDLKIASARIAQTRAARASAKSAFLPTINMMGNANRQENQIAFPQPIPGLSQPFDVFEAGFDASWELDIFGGKRRAFEASSAALESSKAARDAAMVSLFAEVARTYVDIRQYQAQIDITDANIAAEQNTHAIVSERYRSGKTSKLDQTQSKAELTQLMSQQPFYQNLLAQSEYSMDVLLGEQPGYTHKFTVIKQAVPNSDKKLVLNAPAQVIANRPDIHMAERDLAEATAQQGVAVAQFFPNISLSGFVGLLNVNIGQLFKTKSKSYTATGNILIPILNLGALEAQLDAANGKQQEALATYQKSIISALSDVAKAVTAYRKQEEFREALYKTVIANRETIDIARQRYREGLSNYIDVLDAERALYASESQRVQAEAQTSQQLIAVYKSLGGGWKRNL